MVRRRSTVRFRKGAPERKHGKRHSNRLWTCGVAFSVFRLSMVLAGLLRLSVLNTCRDSQPSPGLGPRPAVGDRGQFAHLDQTQNATVNSGANIAPQSVGVPASLTIFAEIRKRNLPVLYFSICLLPADQIWPRCRKSNQFCLALFYYSSRNDGSRPGIL